MTSKPNYTLFDLQQIIKDLDDHYDPFQRDEYTASCSCSEPVGQDVNKCPVCERWIVWRNSNVWRNKYGSPKTFIRSLSMVRPSDPAGVRICELAGVVGFANQAEADRWADCLRQLGEARMLGIVSYIQRAAKRKGTRRGRGIVNWAFNVAVKNVREQDEAYVEVPQSQRRQEETDVTDIIL
ncbi:MAG: hypothetical protein GY832_20115 [Chloroflexi bacterium]|nr:hypothetical protein [Chloroflexota bacterium]